MAPQRRLMQSLILIYAAWAASSSAVLQNSTTLTLDEALALASTQAFSVRTAEINAAKAQDLVDLSKTAQGLNVKLNGGYTHIEQQGVRAVPGGMGGPAPDQTVVSLAISQVIDITGVIGKAVSQARLQRESQALLVKSEVNKVKGQVRSSYFQILQADALVANQAAEVNAAKERLAKAEIRFKNDAIPKFDVIRFETELRRSEQALTEAKLNAVLSRQSLNNLLGRPIDTPLKVVALTGLPPEALDPSAVTQKALTQRPDLKAGEKNLEALVKVMERERLGMGPQLSVGAQHSETLSKVPLGGARGTTAAVINISLPLYDSHLTRTKVRFASKDVEQASILLDQARLGIALEVRSALTRLASTFESYATAKKTKELAQEGLRLAQLRYDEGVGILVDVTSAQSEFTRASNAVVIAEYQIHAAYAELQRAAGADSLIEGDSK